MFLLKHDFLGKSEMSFSFYWDLLLLSIADIKFEVKSTFHYWYPSMKMSMFCVDINQFRKYIFFYYVLMKMTSYYM